MVPSPPHAPPPILAGQGRRRSAGAHYLDRGTGYLVLEPSAYDGLR
jgi:hypothetical protein